MKKRLTSEFVEFIKYARERGALDLESVGEAVSKRQLDRWIESANEGTPIELKATKFATMAERLSEVLKAPHGNKQRETLAKYKALGGPVNFSKITAATVGDWLRNLAYPAPAAPAAPAAPSLFAPFHSYLRTVAKACSRVVLRGIDIGGVPDQQGPRLAHVYAQLETGTARPPQPGQEQRIEAARGNLSALDVLLDPEQRRVVLVGEPGSGKSTFLQYVTLCLADRRSGLNGEPSCSRSVQVPEPLASADALPFLIVLRDFALELDGAGGTAEDVVRHLDSQLGGHEEARTGLRALLKRADTPAFVLFDGLDEVPREKLAAVRRAIRAFAESDCQHCRVAVTCRTASYERKKDPVFTLQGFPKPYVLAPLSRALQGTFIHAWYLELEQIGILKNGEGAGCASTLLRAIDGDTSERLREMAGCPFFLTAMAALHRPDKRLPDTAAELMNALVDGILEERRKQRADSDDRSRTSEPELKALLNHHRIRMADFRFQLEKLAYQARTTRSGDGESRLIPEGLLSQRLHAVSKKLTGDDVDQLMEALLLRAGLLQSRDNDTYEFAYRFEEFLAGCHLANREAWMASQTPEFHLRACQLLREQRRGYEVRQLVLWATGFKSHVEPTDKPGVLFLVRHLIERGTGDGGSTLEDLELAAAIARDAQMEDWSEDRIPGTEDVVVGLRERLETVRDDAAHHDIKSRAKAASAIGRLADLRAGVGITRKTTVHPDIPKFVWCGPNPNDPRMPFPAADFAMGGDPKAYGNSPEPFTCTRIGQPFLIAKFPVTVEQYQAFVDDHGYEAGGDAHWTDAGRLWRDGKADIAKWPDFAKDYFRKLTFPIRGPENYSPEFQTPNHPRVGVSWYEAMAFCRWLDSDRIRPHLLTAAGVKGPARIRLAADAEWELAARWSPGAKKDPAVMRTFPWGTPEEDESTLKAELTKRCNWHGTGIGHTSAVGLFPSGDAHCGASDMAGNVWEWCRTKWTDLGEGKELAKYHKSKEAEDLGDADAGVVRGGSWFDGGPDGFRAADRGDRHPGGRDYGCGFRVVLCVGECR